MITLKENASYTASGGTDLTLTATGKDVVGGREYINTAETNFFVREEMRLKSTMPSAQPDGTWSKTKVEALIVRRAKLTDGQVVYNTARVEITFHPESGTAESDNLKTLAVSALTDSELVDFFRTGSVPA